MTGIIWFILGVIFFPVLDKIWYYAILLYRLNKIKKLYQGEDRETAKRNAGEWRND